MKKKLKWKYSYIKPVTSVWTLPVVDSVDVSLPADVRHHGGAGGSGGYDVGRLVSPVSLPYHCHVFVSQRNVAQKLV